MENIGTVMCKTKPHTATHITAFEHMQGNARKCKGMLRKTQNARGCKATHRRTLRHAEENTQQEAHSTAKRAADRQNILIGKCFEKFRCVPKIVSPEAQINVRKCFDKNRCVHKIASPEARQIWIRKRFDRYRCVPKIASPEARKDI